MPELTVEQAKQMHKKAYLKGALTQLSLAGNQKEALKPKLEKLAKIYDSAVTKREAFRAAIVGK